MLRILCAIGIGGGVASAAGGLVTIELDREYSGGAPAGAGPWLRATFEDVAGGVRLTLDNLLTGPAEFIRNWYFNLDPSLTPGLLSIQRDFGPTPVAIDVGVDQFKAASADDFDVRVRWPTAHSNASRFDHDHAGAVFTITSSEALAAAAFAFRAGAADDGFFSAAHVQGIGPGGQDSGWISGDPTVAVPSPGAGLLAGIGLALAAVARRRV